MRKFKVLKGITKKECPWLTEDLHIGDIVYEYLGHTYEVISENGIAVTRHSMGEPPFFEVPRKAITWIN